MTSEVSVLNSANLVKDDKAEYLRDIELSGLHHRRMDIYIDHTDMMLAVGYEDENLVWVSRTPVSDVFSSRRVFECMREGEFYRRVKLKDVFVLLGLTLRDLQTMCYVKVDGVELDNPVFSGVITGSGSGDKLTGVTFASLMASLPTKLRAKIPTIGSEDDILSVLEKDSQFLDELYQPGSELDVLSKRKVDEIRAKWLKSDCLKLADRAMVRILYRKVCYFEENVVKLSVANVNADE